MFRATIANGIGIVGLCGVALATFSLNQGPDRLAHSHGNHVGKEAAPAHAVHAGAGHDHAAVLDLSAGPAAPTLSVAVTPDAESGWNLRIDTSNFRFAPAQASGAHREGEGHAHVYVNGTKLARVYGRWFHIGTLPRGTVEVTVTLNSNDHRALAVAGAPLSVTRKILVD